ncbi:exodeoxyribonuclease VII large subunit [Litoribaculum gwangyangense]|uniref:Exonuclease VII large subunit C-terminal domain-containing protein n=1 Tax=Litoribaculum gwangyangense TaxID=1130722 RepID=A0ABP9C5L8_9FLAO
MNKTNNTITVSTLQSLYANSLSSTLDGQLLILEGFYFHQNGKLYGKYYYDEIVSKDKQCKITSQFTQDLKEQLTDGKYYQFEGFINKSQNLSNDSKINVLFTVTKILKYEKRVQLISEVEYDVVEARFKRDFPLIEDLLINKIENGLKPRIEIITGVKSTSQDDYMSQLLEANYYDIRHHRCNLSSKNETLEFLNKFDFSNSDLLVIIRGGGSGLEVFNEVELCKKAIELPIPFITGIGHDEDKTLFEKVADRGFSTPTAVGAFLQKVIITYKNRNNALKIKDEELIQFKKQADKETKLLSSQIMAYKKTLNIIWIVLVVLIALLGVLVFKVNS